MKTKVLTLLTPKNARTILSETPKKKKKKNPTHQTEANNKKWMYSSSTPNGSPL